MLKQRNEQVQLVVKSVDIAIAGAAFFGAYLIRSRPGNLAEWGSLAPIESFTWILAASIVLHFLIYNYFGFYQSLRLKSVGEIIGMVLRAAVVEFFVLGALVFFFQAKETSRYFFGLFLLLNYGFVLAERVGARLFLATLRRRGYNVRRLLIVGSGPNSRRVAEVFRSNPHWGYVVSGSLREPNALTRDDDGIEGVPVLGQLSDLERVLKQQPIDEVYFALESLSTSALEQSTAICERVGIPSRFSLALFDLPLSKATVGMLRDLPVMTFYTTLRTPWEAALKRTMDIAVSLVGLAITALLYPWIALKIRASGPGPIIFKQPRVGENGRIFKCYKFRTMVIDAEAKKAELAAVNQMQGPLFKLKHDPRVTPFGDFLRRTSLDELPQFFNILRGDMSVVGTRPPTPDEVALYELTDRRRLSIRPGLTGLWQVSGRNEIRRFEDVVRLDLQYIDRWSLWLDVQIIFRTVWMIVSRRGAY